ncbi:MAG TPA: amidase [Woeseiaceae bacterium]|nr:amidase [Woeseiaceae bacterium]
MVTRRAFIGGLSGTALLAAARVHSDVSDLTDLTLSEASLQIRARKISPAELARAYLARIAELDPRINSYVTVTGDLALEQARQLDAELDAGHWRGPLHGIPIALKDNMDTAGVRTTAASALFADRVPAADAEVYRRLKEAGAVLLGKLNMHEFAYGGTSSISHFGPVHNPWNLEHIPGGSSGGSAAAVAARLCCAALGTDTLASIRLPAAYCGIVGLKMTHGLASIRGIVPVAESLDHVGPMTRTVADSAQVLQAVAGFDALDPVSLRADIPDYASALNRNTTQLRIGIARSPYYDELDSDVESAVVAALDVLEDLTATFHDIELPPMADFTVLLAEAYAYHERYLSDPANHRLYDRVTLERLLAAGEFSAASYIEERRKLAIARHAIAATLSDIDIIVTPTAPGLPEKIRNAQNPAEASGAEPSVRNTFPFNIFGIPTISVPCGFSRSGLPIGLQISGPPLGELSVLALAQAYEQATAWHNKQAPLA